MLEGLQERLLHGVFGVFAVLGDVLGEAEDLALVAAHQGFEGGDVARFRGRDQGGLVVLDDLRGERVRLYRVEFGRTHRQFCPHKRVAQVEAPYAASR